MPVLLKCTVRGCVATLSRVERTWTCAAGHAFDENRRGILNLLQPQDRRSKSPGDSKDAVAARHRLAGIGYANDVHRTIERVVRSRSSQGSALLDVGCGEGAFLRAISDVELLDRHGIDLSSAAIDLAAKSTPGVRFVVANADRSLPYADGSFDFVVSIDARLNAPEFARVIKPTGLAFLAVPAPDDLIELREAIAGARVERPRTERVLAEVNPVFEVVERMATHERRTMSSGDLKDLLAATYRGFRRAAQAKVRELGALSVTLSHEVLALKKR